MQILSVVKATYPARVFPGEDSPDMCNGEPGSDVVKLECYWQQANSLVRKATNDPAYQSDAESALIVFARAAQELMSSAASNYDISRLNLGITVATLAAALAGVACWIRSLKWSGCTFFFTLVVVGYAVIMFASSYVEEEQQFWYWMLSGWQFYLYTRSYVVFHCTV